MEKFLFELLENADENKNFYVYHNGKLISLYDGKNSIDSDFNDYPVFSYWVDENGHTHANI